MNKTTIPASHIEIYTTPKGAIQLDVRTDASTVWLSLDEMAKLFQRHKSVVSRHLANVFKEKELSRRSVVAKFATTAIDGKTYQVEYFNLDAIISVGYRVNSKVGTRFRVWATEKIRQHLLDGYTLNRQRLSEKGVDLEAAVRLLGKTLKRHDLVTDEGHAMVDLVGEYARSWRLLLAYDENTLPEVPRKARRRLPAFSAVDARAVIGRLVAALKKRKEASKLFALERGEGLDGILGNIDQTFDGVPLYPSVEARAAHLLYFVIKDHPFADGNKRIACLLFLHYLDRAGMLLKQDGQQRFNDSALVALALLVAESDPGQKDLMVRLIMSMLEDGAD